MVEVGMGFLIGLVWTTFVYLFGYWLGRRSVMDEALEVLDEAIADMTAKYEEAISEDAAGAELGRHIDAQRQAARRGLQ